MTRVIFLCAMISAMTLPAVAADEASPERGKQLFSSRELGTNGKSCATCHPGGKGVEAAGQLPEGELAEVINRCIKKPLRGRELDPDSAQMRSLIAYVKSLPAGKRK